MMAAAHIDAIAASSAPDSADTPPEQTHQKPPRHKTKTETHRAGEQPGKPPEKATAATPKAGDQKAHAAPPVAATPPAPPREKPPAKEATEPPPKLPRFAALKTDDTNMRKGPGQRYPIEWVYQRRDLPMEVEREYDVWRYVRDPDGIEGWVHQVTLSDRRTFVIKDKDATMRSDAKDTASPVALLKVGVIGRLRECDEGSTWCQVQVGGYKGYLRRDQFWGLLPDEVVAPS
jgi:SH3-like domain-containing protein